MIYQYAININEVIDYEQLNVFKDCISDERKRKIDKFNFSKDKIRSILAEVLLRYILENKYDINQSKIRFEYGKYGKPYLAQNKQGIHFNLSHSGAWVMCGIGNSSIGIDVEELKEKELFLAKLVLSNAEYELWRKQTIKQRREMLYIYWTLKESYSKHIGKGLYIPFDTLSFQIDGEKVTLHINEKRDEMHHYVISNIDKEHCVALCVDRQAKDEVVKEIQIIKLEDLFKWKS